MMLELSVIETAFTPWQSLAGGVLIGLASVLLMLSLGRIMGATGILAGVLTPSAHPDKGWRLAILAGMVSGPLALLALTGAMPAVEVPVSMPMLVLGGFLAVGGNFARLRFGFHHVQRIACRCGSSPWLTVLCD